MSYLKEVFNSGIVVIGDFNPAIFTPDWLEKNGLIGEQDASFARENESLVISHQVSSIETEWFSLQVLENQFALTGKGVLRPAIRDLASGIFELLSHTPVTALGMNFLGHYKIASIENYHKFGDALAPKGIWDDAYNKEASSFGLTGLSIQIKDTPRDEIPKNADAKNITVQPSTVVARQGIFMQYNDHRDIAGRQKSQTNPAELIVSILNNEWDDAWRSADFIFNGVISKALGV